MGLPNRMNVLYAFSATVGQGVGLVTFQVAKQVVSGGASYYAENMPVRSE